MHSSRLLLALTSLCGLSAAYPGLMAAVAPADRYRAAHELRAERLSAHLERRQAATMTRGSQTEATAPCFDVYQITSPTPNPTGYGPDFTLNHGYQPPGTNDVRAPCPALNTLANHGYLPRDGRGINGSQLAYAFAVAFGIDESVISVAADNALAVCGFQSGGSENGNEPAQCDNFDLNILNTPHMFEHDHSLSRRDYEEIDSITPKNNHVFDPIVFNETLATLGDGCYMNTSQADAVRLQREATQYTLDKPGWITLAPGVQETEIGFIFAVMSENNQPYAPPDENQLPEFATVRVDWWQYWFMYESFPTQLGWQVPSPLVKNAFVTSISSMVETGVLPASALPTPFLYQFINGVASTETVDGTILEPLINNIYSQNLGPLVAKRTALPEAEAMATPAVVEAAPTPVWKRS